MGARHRVADRGDEQARQEARVQAARPEDDELGLGDGREGVIGRADVLRRQPDAIDPGRAHDLRLTVDGRAVGQPGVEGQRRGRDRDDLATDGQDAVHQADPVLEVAVLDGCHRGDQQVPQGVAGQATGLASGWLRESVLEDLAHQWFGVGQRDDAVADVADRRDPELVPQHARRAAVVGHGHDRGQVAGVLLEATQEDGQAGPTADRDDPRPAGEEAPLVEELDQRLVRIGRPERVGQDAEGPVRPEGDERDADRGGDEPAQPERQELERQQVDQAADEPGRGEVAGDLAQEMGEGDGQQEQAREDDDEPALDPDAGRQPAPEVHVRSSSRWKTATGPKSWLRNQLASSSVMTIER